jgi:uncharacterized protein (DUF427 family)
LTRPIPKAAFSTARLGENLAGAGSGVACIQQDTEIKKPKSGKNTMKAIWNGAVIAQSDETVVLEGNHYFPESSLNRDYVTFSNHHTMCSWKGQASYYSLLVNGEMNTDAAWYYPEPKREAENIKGHVAFWKGVKIEA